MITPHKNYTLSEVKKGDYILQVNNNSYLIGHIIFDILNKNQLLSKEDEVFLTLIETHKELNKIEIINIIENNIHPIFNQQNISPQKNPVKKVFKLLNPHVALPFFKQ